MLSVISDVSIGIAWEYLINCAQPIIAETFMSGISDKEILSALDAVTALLPSPAAPPRKQAHSRERYRSLVWSNPAADDSTFIRAALRSAKAVVLADFARDFGLARLQQEWTAIKDTPAGRRLAGDVERILGHIGHAGA